MGKMDGKKYIQTISNYSLIIWDVKMQLNSILNFFYPKIKLSQILSKGKVEWVDIEDDKIYKILGVRAHGQGVYINRSAKGTTLTMKRYQKSEPYHLFYCKVRTVNGQWGVVYPEFEDTYGSSNMQYLKMDLSKINPKYLELLLRLKKLTNVWDKNAIGADSRHFTLKTLLSLEIPLPPLDEQNRVVVAYNNKIKQAEVLEKKAIYIEENIESYLSEQLGIEKGKRNNKSFGLKTISFKEINRWALSYLFKEQRFSMDNVKYPIVPLKTLITFFEGGKTPSTSRKDFWGGDINWTSAKDMKSLFLDSVQDQITEKVVNEAKLKVYPRGTILGVFRSGILRHSFPVTLTQMETAINQDLKAIGVNEEIVCKEYFLFYLKTFQKFILERAQKFGVTVESINTDEFLEIPVVLPPLPVQEGIVKSIRGMLYEINELRSDSISLKDSAINEFENEIFKPCN